MARLVTFSVQLSAPDTPTVGRRLSALTVELRNQNNVLKQTLTYPVNIVQQLTGPSYTYLIEDLDIDDRSDWPGTYLVAKSYGVDFATGQESNWQQVVVIDDAVAVPELDVARRPYADLTFALTHFQTSRRGREWLTLFATSPADAYLLLTEASDDLDTEHYKGMKVRVHAYDTSADQRQFPRVFETHETAGYYAGLNELVPNVIKQACCEQALWLYQQEARGHDHEARRQAQNFGVTSVSRGRSTEAWDLDKAQHTRICKRAYELIHPFLAQGVSDFPGGL